jgi:hypothetical protein
MGEGAGHAGPLTDYLTDVLEVLAAGEKQICTVFYPTRHFGVFLCCCRLLSSRLLERHIVDFTSFYIFSGGTHRCGKYIASSSLTLWCFSAGVLFCRHARV